MAVTNTNNAVDGTKTAFEKSSAAEVTVTKVTGVVETWHATSLPIIVYPNPTDGKLLLQFESQGEYMVTITDMAGKILLRPTVKDQPALIDISNFTDCVYLLNINDGKQQSTMRIMKN